MSNDLPTEPEEDDDDTSTLTSILALIALVIFIGWLIYYCFEEDGTFNFGKLLGLLSKAL